MLRSVATTPLRVRYSLRLLSYTRPAMNNDTPANQRTDGPAFTSMLASLQQGFPAPSTIAVFNDSYNHAGHHGTADSQNKSESHIRLEIVSGSFAGLNLPKRHRMVYKLLEPDMKQYDVHAVQLLTRTPEEAAKK